MENKNIIFIDDGSKTYTIKNKSGKVVGDFTFNPADTNIVKRYEEAVKRIDNLKSTDYPDSTEGLLKLSEDVKKEIDFIIGYDSQPFFEITGVMSPLVTGEFFFENVISAIGKVIEIEMGKRVEKVKFKARKYSGKYRK